MSSDSEEEKSSPVTIYVLGEKETGKSSWIYLLHSGKMRRKYIPTVQIEKTTIEVTTSVRPVILHLEEYPSTQHPSPWDDTPSITFYRNSRVSYCSGSEQSRTEREMKVHCYNEDGHSFHHTQFDGDGSDGEDLFLNLAEKKDHFKPLRALLRLLWKRPELEILEVKRWREPKMVRLRREVLEYLMDHLESTHNFDTQKAMEEILDLLNQTQMQKLHQKFLSP